MYAISYRPSNVQVKKFMPPSSIGGFPCMTPSGKTEFKYFMNEFGEESDLVIPDGGELILDPENPIHKHNIAVFQSFIKVYPGIAANFVVSDLTVDKEQKRSIRKSKSRALLLVADIANNQDFDTLLAIARRLGNRKFNIDRVEAVDYLEEIADSDPDLLIKALEDPEREMRFLVEKAIDKVILSRDKAGMIKYGPIEGGQPIGNNEDEAIIYLKQNPPLLEQIMSEVENKPLPMVVSRERSVAVIPDAEAEAVSNEDLLKEVDRWIAEGVLKAVKDDKGKIKEISYSSLVMGKTPEKVVDFLQKNKHFVTILRQRAAK